MITDEKFNRLTRETPFSVDEQWGFINCQLVETRQSTKVVTELLKEFYPESQIVYVKAGLVSDFRKEFELVKCRSLNDLHHAKDAYLNIVVGNVWHSKFTRDWFYHDGVSRLYNIQTKKIFAYPVGKNGCDWAGASALGDIRRTMAKNYIHFTSFAYCRHGQLFEQTVLKKSAILYPRKKELPPDIYGGYNSTSASFGVLTKIEHLKKKKRELYIIPVELLVAERFLQDDAFSREYVRKTLQINPNDANIVISFPHGFTPIKIKSVFEVDDGLRFRLNGKKNDRLIISIFSPLLLDNKWESYIKHLENFARKKCKNPKIEYCEKYDIFTSEKNLELYDVLIGKLKAGMFSRHPQNLIKKLSDVREQFKLLTPSEQVEILLGVIKNLGTGSDAGINLKTIDKSLSGSAGATSLNQNIVNWKKFFTVVRLVNSSSSGLFEVKSENLLDIISNNKK